MPRIIAELQQVDYLAKIVLSLDRADEGQFKTAKKHMARTARRGENRVA